MRFGGPVVPLVSMRTATPGRRLGDGRRAAAGTATVDRFAERAERAARGRRQRRRGQQREVVGLADEQRKPERRAVGAEPLGAEQRVHRDDARAGAQQPEQRAERRRTVAQHEPDRRPAPRPVAAKRRVDLIGRRRQVAPGGPTRRSNSSAGADGSSAMTARSRSGERRSSNRSGVRAVDSGAHRLRRDRPGCRGACT